MIVKIVSAFFFTDLIFFLAESWFFSIHILVWDDVITGYFLLGYHLKH